MNPRSLSRRDLTAFAFAAIGTLTTSLLNGPIESDTVAPLELTQPDPALDGLLDPETARAEGAWWLDDPSANARLSYAPEHERLVWRVRGADREVLLDAKTGEALAFGY